MSLPDGVDLQNLHELKLIGSGCIKNCLESFGKGLSRLKKFELVYGISLDYEDTYPLVMMNLPQTCFLNELVIDLRTT